MIELKADLAHTGSYYELTAVPGKSDYDLQFYLKISGSSIKPTIKDCGKPGWKRIYGGPDKYRDDEGFLSAYKVRGVFYCCANDAPVFVWGLNDTTKLHVVPNCSIYHMTLCEKSFIDFVNIWQVRKLLQSSVAKALDKLPSFSRSASPAASENSLMLSFDAPAPDNQHPLIGRSATTTTSLNVSHMSTGGPATTLHVKRDRVYYYSIDIVAAVKSDNLSNGYVINFTCTLRVRLCSYNPTAATDFRNP